MKLYKLLGVWEGLLNVCPPEVKERQLKIYNWLVVMVIVIAGFTGLACYTYGTIIFQSVAAGIGSALFFGLVSYNLFTLVLIVSLTPMHKLIYRIWIDKRDKKHAFRDLNDEFIAGLQSEAEIHGYLYNIVQSFRQESALYQPKQSSFLGQFSKNLFLVTVMVLLALIVANGVELFLFRSQLNETLGELLQSKFFQLDPWIKKHILTPEKGKSFVLINSNSLLLDLELLTRGLGGWKIAMDILMLFIFIFPFVLMHRSAEFLKGDYIRELTLSELFLTNEYYILSRQKTFELEEHFKPKDDFEEKLYERLYGFPKPDPDRIVI